MSFWQEFLENLITHEEGESNMTVEEQEAIDQIKEVIVTTLSKLPAVSNCSIKVTWNLHNGDSEDFMRPDVEITYADKSSSSV